jgi:hypothetical protein
MRRYWIPWDLNSRGIPAILQARLHNVKFQKSEEVKEFEVVKESKEVNEAKQAKESREAKEFKELDNGIII